jgi:hypothetical protein
MRNRRPEPSEIYALDPKWKFRRFDTCSVSATIGIERSTFKIRGESGVIGVSEKRPSAMIDQAVNG